MVNPKILRKFRRVRPFTACTGRHMPDWRTIKAYPLQSCNDTIFINVDCKHCGALGYVGPRIKPSIRWDVTLRRSNEPIGLNP